MGGQVEMEEVESRGLRQEGLLLLEGRLLSELPSEQALPSVAPLLLAGWE